MIEQKIGKRIQQYRKKKGYTQAQLSEMVGVTPHHMSSFERGIYNIKLDILVQILNILECSADDVFCDVVDQSCKAQATRLSAQMEKIPPQEQEKIYNVVETMINNAK